MMDSKSGTRIDNSLRYCVLFSNNGDPGHAMFVAFSGRSGEKGRGCRLEVRERGVFPDNEKEIGVREAEKQRQRLRKGVWG